MARGFLTAMYKREIPRISSGIFVFGIEWFQHIHLPDATPSHSDADVLLTCVKRVGPRSSLYIAGIYLTGSDR